jgi:hypothetical protein
MYDFICLCMGETVVYGYTYNTARHTHGHRKTYIVCQRHIHGDLNIISSPSTFHDGGEWTGLRMTLEFHGQNQQMYVVTFMLFLYIKNIQISMMCIY